jgi:hypothetical protein
MCERIAGIIRAWEKTGELAAEQLLLIQNHLAECRSCARAWGSLLPLLRRDAGWQSGLAVPEAGPSPAFTERLMQRVSGWNGRRAPTGNPRVWAFVSRGALRWALPLAAALALLIGAGTVVRSQLLRSATEQIVHFELVAPQAKSVFLAGAKGNGVWEITVKLRKGISYRYNFLIDGTRWEPDPGAPLQVDDGFGGKSSVLRL